MKNKNDMKVINELQILSILFLLVLFSTDFITTVIALNNGAVETNIVLGILIEGNSLGGYIAGFFFLISTVFIFVFLAEFIGYIFYKVTNEKLCYLISYIMIVSLMSMISISAILNNIFVILQLI